MESVLFFSLRRDFLSEFDLLCLDLFQPLIVSCDEFCDLKHFVVVVCQGL